MKTINRRNFLAAGAGLPILLASTAAASRALAASVCQLTPPQTEGPFYPVQDQPDKDSDLTQIQGSNAKAIGEVIFVEGQVLDIACKPIANALVEIWQACASGKYNHPGDTSNPAPLDPNFQYWGRATTNANGRYSFKTIKPGSYPAGDGWIRPPHIHFKVSRLGYLELTTQMYFAGESYNEKDRVLQRIPKAQRNSVIVDLKQAASHSEGKTAEFNVTLESP